MEPENPLVISDEAMRAAEAYRQQKRTSVLSIVFTDIANSTPLLESLGEPEYGRLKEENEAFMREAVAADGAGSVVQFLGDGALAVFSEPSTAVERCIGIQKAMRDHPYFKIRIGIDMGQVAVASQGGIVRDVFGSHVNRSARIESLAEPGHVLTSFTVYDCAVGWLRALPIKWHCHGPIILKGFAEETSIHEPVDATVGVPQSRENWRSYGPGGAGREDPERTRRRAAQEVVRASRGDHGSDSISMAFGGGGGLIPPQDAVSPDPLSDLKHEIQKAAEDYVRSFQQICHGSLSPLAPPAILWVDDRPSNNEFEIHLLKSAGWTVKCVTSTGTALHEISRKPFALVITDMNRDGNDTAGLDLLRALKRGPRRPGGWRPPAIVYASHWSVSEYGPRARSEGAILCTSGLISLLDGISQVLSLLSPEDFGRG